LYDVKPKAQSERCAPYRSFAHWVPNSQLLYEMAPLSKGLSLDGGRADFSKNLPRGFLFKKGLSNEPTFGLIHLAGQYL
jgi:hypothetical protein